MALLLRCDLDHSGGSGFCYKLIVADRLRQSGTCSAETGLAHRPSAEGEHISGVYRQRVTLASGRFAMIDDGLGFQLVPWRPALEQTLGQQVSGTLTHGGVDWNFRRKCELGL